MPRLEGIHHLTHKRIHDRVNALVALYLGLHDALIFENGKVLGYHRLWLLNAGPQLRHAQILLAGDVAEELQSYGVTADFELLRELGKHLVGTCNGIGH